MKNDSGQFIEIDGAYGEGGGQIIRTAVALSALTKKPLKIYNIRANRSNPGLQRQHLTGVNAVSEICKARVSHLDVGSSEFTFEPGEITGGNYKWDIGTAGAITLVLQAVMPAIIFSKKQFSIEVTGGTHVNWSPPIDYFQHIFCDYMKKMGAKLDVEIIKHGFYPKGQGNVRLEINSSEMHPIDILSRGKLLQTNIQDSIASSDLENALVAERQVNGFKKEFSKDDYGEVRARYVETASTGSSIHAHNSYENCKIGVEVLGERGKKAEIVGKECAIKLKKEVCSDSTLDTHMLDQVLPYMGMLHGGSFKFSEITSHAKTNMWVIEQFCPVKFETDDNVITCKTSLKK